MSIRNLKWVRLPLVMAVILFSASGMPGLHAQDYSLKDLNEQLVMGTLWYQKSAEMRALAYQAFNLAKLIFDLDLQKGASDKKRAVIVDVDETVLDNSPYEAGLIGIDTGYPNRPVGVDRCRNGRSDTGGG